MYGLELLKEDEATLREIIRSIDKKLDYSLREGVEARGPNFTLHLARQSWKATVTLSIDELKAAKSDRTRRNAIRQKIKRQRDHMGDSRFLEDVLGTKPARMLRQSTRPDEGFYRQGMRRPPKR